MHLLNNKDGEKAFKFVFCNNLKLPLEKSPWKLKFSIHQAHVKIEAKYNKKKTRKKTKLLRIKLKQFMA
jgi:hypothetical protein